jgi:hypothetical protein
MCSGKIHSSCSTWGINRVILATNLWISDHCIVITTNGTYPVMTQKHLGLLHTLTYTSILTMNDYRKNG